MRSLAGSKPETRRGLRPRRRLKALEELTRRSDERNTKTFEAIHDTLLKIVDRLGSLEARPSRERAAAEPAQAGRSSDAPSIDADEAFAAGSDAEFLRQPLAATREPSVERTPAEAAAAAAVAALGSRPMPTSRNRAASRVRSMFGGLTARLQRQEGSPAGAGSLPARSRPNRPSTTRPSVDLDEPLDPEARQPAARAGLRRTRPQRDHAARARRARPAGQARHSETDAAKSDFIAAARRAAQAAAAEAEVMKRQSDDRRPGQGAAARRPVQAPAASRS